MCHTVEELHEVERLTDRINGKLDSMYAKLGKLIVAVETVNEAFRNLPLCGDVRDQTQALGRPIQ